MLIDIGVNLSNSRLQKSIEDVLLRAKSAGVEKMILTGTSISDSESVISICNQYKFAFSLNAAAGSDCALAWPWFCFSSKAPQ